MDKFQSIDFSNELMKYITGRALTNEEAIDRYSFNLRHTYFGAYFVENSKGDQVIGLAVIKDKNDEAEIGYMVLEPYNGQGFATEINRTLIEICKNYLTGRIISAYTDMQNKASIRVLTKSKMTKVDTFEEDGIVVCKYIF